MRIVEVSTNLVPSPPPRGGAIEKYVFNISKSLVTLGFEVHLISVDDKYSVSKIDGIIRYTYPRKTSNFDKIVGRVAYRFNPHAKKMDLLSTLNIYNILSCIEETYDFIDIIHNHSLTTAMSPVIFKNIRSKNTLLVMHHHNVFQRNIINESIIRQYDLHLTVSRYVKNEIVKRFKISPERVFVVHNAIDVSKYKCIEPEQSRLRNSFKDKNDIVLLYVGRIVPEKGLHHLIEALKIVRQRLSSTRVKLLIVGPVGQFHSSSIKDMVYFQFIKKLIHSYGLYNDVKYLGYCNENSIIDVYTVADIVVVPSVYQEPFGFVIIEALASCKPVIAYPVGGIPEILEPLNYGLLAKSISPIELSEAIIRIISNYDNVNLKHLREYVERRFSIESAAKRLKAIFERYVKNRS